jgi:hypothetical protein
MNSPNPFFFLCEFGVVGTGSGGACMGKRGRNPAAALYRLSLLAPLSTAEPITFKKRVGGLGSSLPKPYPAGSNPTACFNRRIAPLPG